MTQRENLLRAMRRQPHEFVPSFMTLCTAQQEQFCRATGSKDYTSHFDLCGRYVRLGDTLYPNDYSRFTADMPPDAVINEWGVGKVAGSIAHFTKMYHPMERFDTVEEVMSYPYPDRLADYRWETVREQVAAAHAEGRAAIFYAIQIFEYAWYLRGLENMLMDMLTDEEMAAACLDKMTELQCAVAKRAAASGADIIVFGDDVGTQRELMMSRELWLRFLKPGLAAVIASAKAVNPQVLAYYHSDGVIYDIIPDLIEIGVDILNPIQPECMDPARVKREYGDRLSFWGTIGTQTTMPFGTAQDVEDAVREMIAVMGADGGFCVAPTHLLEPEVPWANIEAFVNAAKLYGGRSRL